MKNQIAALSSTFIAATSVYASKTYPACPPISGNLTVNLRNIYPEGVDFFPSNCKIYVGSLNNNTLIEYDPYTSTTEVIEFPGITHNAEYFVCGVDYSFGTDTLYVSANARAPWYNEGSNIMGTNLTGPNRLIHYSPLNRSIIWEVDVNPLVEEIERGIGAQVGGLQDQAEDKDGNAYYPTAWGNVIIKISVNGQASKFYVPEPDKLNTCAYGFGGLFISEDNVLVLSDAVSQSFAIFNLSGPNPSEPFFSKPANLPAGYSTALFCDSLIAPKRFNNTIALCADVFDAKTSPHGIIAVYSSGDGWKTSEYLGAIPIEFNQAPNAWSTATFEAMGSIYALTAALPYEKGTFPQVDNTALVDITETIGQLL
ncbi:hypothetical protein K469DRAFT_752753 [Zopfia rhizophila CBS 207.26]|uniref:Uncharacterized protein n=1 Tax=Zopfia rhizophila CBS 207.26 TaxID=1314779 RepID=A0A6A6DPM2_9PEZI|nr:hypothetical protein K469DRAFT_752753 [Zopfia rhizophila CBS 207.26]